MTAIDPNELARALDRQQRGVPLDERDQAALRKRHKDVLHPNELSDLQKSSLRYMDEMVGTLFKSIFDLTLDDAALMTKFTDFRRVARISADDMAMLAIKAVRMLHRAKATEVRPLDGLQVAIRDAKMLDHTCVKRHVTATSRMDTLEARISRLEAGQTGEVDVAALQAELERRG